MSDTSPPRTTQCGNRLYVLSHGAAGREEEYLKWYEQQHFGDIMAIDVVRQGQLCVEVNGRLLAAIYDLDEADGTIAAGEIVKRRGTPLMPLSSALDRASIVFTFARPMPESPTSLADELAHDHRIVALSAGDANSAPLLSEIGQLLDSMKPSVAARREYTLASVELGNPFRFRRLSYAALSLPAAPDIARAVRERSPSDDAAGASEWAGLFRVVRTTASQ